MGGFGSNAYAYKQIIPSISFALEKLSPEPDHLRTIVAHEFGHVAQNIITNEAGTDWSKMQWTEPLTWLYREGAAIHFSRKTAAKLQPASYFSFDDKGQEWLTFAESNQQEIKKAFAEDYLKETPLKLFHEWFSIRGGEKFGFSRLAYFLGDKFFQDQIARLGEMNAIIAWKEMDFVEQVKGWLFAEKFK